MDIRNAILAEQLPLPPIPPGIVYQYVIAGNGLFIRAEDSRIEAMVPIAAAHAHGLLNVEPYARLKVPRVPRRFLLAIGKSALAHLPNEAMYQLWFDGSTDETGELTDEGWHCINTTCAADTASLKFNDHVDAVIDLHSHGRISAFFSHTDDADETGFRFYCVVGCLGTDETPQIAARVGVYGHHWTVDVETIFDGHGPFIEVETGID